MDNRFYLKIVLSLSGIILFSFLGSWLLISRWSLTLALVSLIIIVFISMFITRLISQYNRQICFFIDSIRHTDFTNRYPEKTGDVLLNNLHKEINRITTVFKEKEAVTQENQNYYEGLLKVITHEIRNTITPVTTLASDMEKRYEQYQAEEIKEGLQIIHSQAQTLLNLLDAYHRLTHLPEPLCYDLPVKTLFGKLKRLLSGEPGHQRIIYQIQDNYTFHADPNLLLLALLNLIRNSLQAIEGKEEGSIQVIAQQAGNSNVIQIIDNGSGIPAALQSAIFVPFYSTKQEGNGIGLSIARRIMQLHHGELTVFSTPDTQTCFTLKF